MALATAASARDRIDVRLRPEQKKLIERAAEISGMTISSFTVSNAVERAQAVIREHEMWDLGLTDAEVFCNALMNPPAPDERLKSAAGRYKDRYLSR